MVTPRSVSALRRVVRGNDEADGSSRALKRLPADFFELEQDNLSEAESAFAKAIPSYLAM